MMRMDDGLEIFLNNNSAPLLQIAQEPLVPDKLKCPDSQRD